MNRLPTERDAELQPPRLAWRRVFPGDERELQAVRRWLAYLLPECAARDDVVMVAVELATNAVKFTASGRGGFFAVEVTWAAPVVRVAVADGGAPTGPHVIDDPLSEHGRGLQLVRAVSTRSGVIGDRRGRLVWAEVRWTAEGAVQPDRFPAGHEDAIREVHAALTRRFAGTPVWFGRFTLQWWAAPGHVPGRLLSAPSAQELAEQLDRVLEPRRHPLHMTAAKRTAPHGCGQAGAPGPAADPTRRRPWTHVLRLRPQPC
jgi:Histidine kinase-like ATPase domain